jgi:hypothetical protein
MRFLFSRTDLSSQASITFNKTGSHREMTQLRNFKIRGLSASCLMILHCLVTVIAQKWSRYKRDSKTSQSEIVCSIRKPTIHTNFLLIFQRCHSASRFGAT